MRACPTFLQVSDETEWHDAMRRGCCERRCCNGRKARRVSAWLAGFLSGSLRKLISVKSRCQTFLGLVKQSFDAFAACGRRSVRRRCQLRWSRSVNNQKQPEKREGRDDSGHAGRRQQRRFPRHRVTLASDAAPIRRAKLRPAGPARHASSGTASRRTTSGTRPRRSRSRRSPRASTAAN